MSDIERTGIDPILLSAYLTRALSIDYELNHRLESAEMFEEARLLREQAACCLRSLAQIQNLFEAAAYREGRSEPSVFNISETVEDIFGAVRSKTRNAKVKFGADIEEGLLVTADPERFSACLVNLIVNAFQNVDQEEGEVKITLKRASDFAAVSEIDNGYGMSGAEVSERLSRDDGCCGFDILKKFCNSVGTSPLIETTENGGFSVTVRIPLAPPSESLEFKADIVRMNMGVFSPSSLLIYKYDGASVLL